MKITALVTTLILGLSSAAFAAPSESAYRGPAQHGPIARDHRMPQRPMLPRWTTLSSSTRLIRGKQQINVASASAFTKLKLEAANGSTFVDKVLITFGNGRTQLVELDQSLTAYSPLVIDLAGQSRKISKIVVFGKGNFRSSYNVLAV